MPHSHSLLPRWGFRSPQLTTVLGFHPIQWFMRSEGPRCLSASRETLLEKGQPTALRGHVRVMRLLGAFLVKSYLSIRRPNCHNWKVDRHFHYTPFRNLTDTFRSLLKLDNIDGYFALISPSVCTHIPKRHVLRNNTHSFVTGATEL
jgi:hypothetical protein